MTEATEQELRHNTLNEVTGGIHLVTAAGGRKLVRKRLRPPTGGTGLWRASDDRRSYTWWRREAEVYADPELRRSVERAGLGLPQATVEDDGDGRVLWLDWAEGRTAEELTLDDHVTFAAGLGRWQARPIEADWASRRFLREYAGGQLQFSVDTGAVALMEDDAAWRHPLIAERWPAELRSRWQALLADVDRLYDLIEALPRTLCHLDVWPLNLVRRDDGTPILLDWAFTGDGAIGEDVGNAIPDACFDLCWPAERIRELDTAMTTAYVDGLREAGWRGDPRLARLGIVASCVKYSWLLPRMVLQATDDKHVAYFRSAESTDFYGSRGLVFELLTDWHDEARSLSTELGVA